MIRHRFDSRSFCIFLLLAIPSLAFAQSNLFTTISLNPTTAAATQVATGDFNGDGIMDMAVTVPSQGVVNVFIGTGDGNYGPSVSYPANTNPIALVAGDFNGDGHTDLAVANTVGLVSVLFGKGDGTFTAGGSYAAGLFPIAIGAGDFDGDGNLDLAVVDFGQGSTPGSVTILLGNPDGGFRNSNTYTVGASPVTIAVGDFTGDGKPDLAVGFDGTVGISQSQVVIFTNTGGGSFQSGAVLTALVPGGITSVAAGDFDGDGRLDLAAVSAEASSVTLFHGNGNGTFNLVSASPSVSKGSLWIAAGDINGDGKIDLVSANVDSTISVLLGNGDATFANQITYPVGNDPEALVLADLNGDGKLDAAIVNYRDSNVQVLLGAGDGTFRAGTYSSGTNPVSITSGDFNRDGIPDLAITRDDSPTGSILILLGDGHGGFKSLPPFSACTPSGPVGPLVSADFDQDGIPDLLVECDFGSGQTVLSYFKGAGDGTFQLLTTVHLGTGNTSAMVVADINSDGIPDLFLSFSDDLYVIPKFPDPQGLFSSTLIIEGEPGGPGGPVPSGSTVAGDFNGDGKTDFLVLSGDFSFTTLLGDGTGNFQIVPSAIAQENVALTADFNGDGLSDMIASSSEMFQVQRSNGDGTFSQVVQFCCDFQAIDAHDFNGDGIPDVLYFLGGGTALRAYLGQLDGSFVDSGTVVPVGAYRQVAVADFDGNGSLDVAFLDSNKLQILINKNSFQPTTTTLSQSATKVVVGQPFNLSASVSSKQGTPSGNVTFKQAGVPQTTVALTAGVAQTTESVIDATGQYSYTALYTGDGTFSGSLSQRLLVNVSAASSITAMTSSKKSSKLGQSVTFTATVKPQYSGVPTGTVEFYSDGQPIGTGTLTGGLASVSIGSLSQGSHTIEADYSGDTSFTTSVGRFTQRVGTASSTVTLASSANPAVYGQSVTLSATVSDSDGVAPTGTVVFSEAGTIYGSVTLSGGVAQLVLPQLSVGRHIITAQYSGDNTDDPAKANLTETIQGASSTTAITSSLNPSNYGQAVIFTATVTSTAGIPDGTVTFKNGNLSLGTVTLSGGQAQLSVTTIDAGTRTIRAVYNGGSTYGTSQSSLQQVVVAAPTTLTLTSSSNPASSGQAVTFTATVNCTTAVPTGTVTFKDGKTVLGTANVVSGQAQFTTSTLTAGTHSMTATFKGTADFGASSSSTLQQVIQ